MPDRLDNRASHETQSQWDAMRNKLEITARREETWLAATEQGWTAARIATAAGVSVQYVRRLVARARASRGETPETSATPEPSELPRLVLTDGEIRGAAANGLRYSLATDAVSLDGGSTWIPPDDPSTPRMPVLVSSRNGPGSRKQFLEPRPYQTPPEPPGPTSYRPSRGLKGGRGS